MWTRLLRELLARWDSPPSCSITIADIITQIIDSPSQRFTSEFFFLDAFPFRGKQGKDLSVSTRGISIPEAGNEPLAKPNFSNKLGRKSLGTVCSLFLAYWLARPFAPPPCNLACFLPCLLPCLLACLLACWLHCARTIGKGRGTEFPGKIERAYYTIIQCGGPRLRELRWCK